MIHFLRNNKNRSIVDCEATKDDLHSIVIVTTFAKELLSLDEKEQSAFIVDMDFMQELRGHWFESNGMLPGVPKFEDPNSLCQYWFKIMSKKWNLAYVTD